MKVYGLKTSATNTDKTEEKYNMQIERKILIMFK